jgi:dienelactone hydrolase
VNTTQQGADILATELGARIAMPDLFKGKPWDLTNFPPPDRNEFLSWLGKTQWPQVEPVLIKTIAYLRESGAKKFGTHTVVMVADVGLYGFCWGGKMAISATKHVRAAALVHPAFIEVSDAEKAVVPICLLDSKDEDKETMDKFIGEVKKKPFGNKVFRKRYDIFHGFCAGRANYGDEDNAKKANEVSITPDERILILGV